MASAGEATFEAYAQAEPGDVVPVYEMEAQVLDLWDQLVELQLQNAVIEAQMGPSSCEQ